MEVMAGSLARLGRGLDETVAYGRMNVMRHFAPSLGVLLFCNWIVSLVGFPAALNVFRDFKVEMPGLTLLTISAFHNFWIWPITSFVAWGCLYLAKRTQVGWWSAIGVCLLCDFVHLSLALPFTALRGLLVSYGDSANPSFSAPWFNTWPIIMMMSFLLTQLILVALILKRRHLTSAPLKIAPFNGKFA